MFRFNLLIRPGDHQAAEDDLDRMADPFDLTKNGLGQDVMDEAVDGIMWNMIQELDPDGVPWPALNPIYEAHKQQVRPGAPMAVFDGIMRTVAQLSGVRFVAPDLAEMEYGTDPVAIAHAVKFTEGGLATGTNQPPRPFYGFTVLAVAAIDDRFDRAFALAIP